jgi:hypothetical protein
MMPSMRAQSLHSLLAPSSSPQNCVMLEKLDARDCNISMKVVLAPAHALAGFSRATHALFFAGHSDAGKVGSVSQAAGCSCLSGATMHQLLLRPHAQS